MAQHTDDLLVDSLHPRIRSKITIADDGCWLWTAAVDRHGYGRVKRLAPRDDGQVTAFAHRYVYELLVGDPGDGDLDHLCRVHGCVNPAHLEPVSHAENMRRGINAATLRAKFIAHLWCPQGHPLFGPNLYLYVTRKGIRNKQCRQCRAEGKRRRRANGKRD